MKLIRCYNEYQWIDKTCVLGVGEWLVKPKSNSPKVELVENIELPEKNTSWREVFLSLLWTPSTASVFDLSKLVIWVRNVGLVKPQTSKAVTDSFQLSRTPHIALRLNISPLSKDPNAYGVVIAVLTTDNPTIKALNYYPIFSDVGFRLYAVSYDVYDRNAFYFNSQFSQLSADTASTQQAFWALVMNKIPLWKNIYVTELYNEGPGFLSINTVSADPTHLLDITLAKNMQSITNSTDFKAFYNLTVNNSKSNKVDSQMSKLNNADSSISKLNNADSQMSKLNNAGLQNPSE